MNRRDFLSQAAAGAAAATLGKTAEAQTSAAKPGSPNFLFMIADDLTFRIFDPSLKGAVKTPNIDRLRAQGAYFTHCYHQGSFSGAVCVPSRTMLNTGVGTFKAEHAIIANQSFEHLTWGQTFRKAGYNTFITGKWHLDAVSLQRSFSEQVSVGPGYLPSTDAMYNRPAAGNNWDPANKELAGHWLHPDIFDTKKPEGPAKKPNGPDAITHSSSVYAGSAIQYLHGRRDKAEPFLMYVGFNAPHDPRQAPQEFLDMYPEAGIALPPNYVPTHPFDQGMAKERDELLAPFPRTEDAVRTHRREYYAIISHLDHEIGRILDALEASGQAKNTYVILTADHGLACGEHGLMGKQNQYECSMRMPLFVRGPKVQAGKTVDHFVYQHCMFATTCDIAGIPVPSHVEFPSLKKMIHEDKAEPLYDATFGWLTNVQRSVRTQQYRLIFYPRINRYQLFDMQADPWELKDVSTDPQFSGALAEMKAHLLKLQESLDDPMLKAKA